MGAGESTLNNNSNNIDTNGEETVELDEYLGFHVLQVQNNSPAFKAGLIPFFDYILSINGIRLVKKGGILRHKERKGSK